MILAVIATLCPPWIFGCFAVYYARKAGQVTDTSKSKIKYDLYTKSLNFCTVGILVGIVILWGIFTSVSISEWNRSKREVTVAETATVSLQ